MKAKICFCPTSIAWIIKHLKKSAKPTFRKMIKGGIETIKRKTKRKKQRTARQLKNDRKLGRMAKARAKNARRKRRRS